ncbi:MAG TPA: ABC transporter permease [Acidimicrobiales bacterium]
MLARITRAPILKLLVRRVVQAVPVVWLVSFITFALMNLLPGGSSGTALQLLGENATPSAIKALNIKLHLNEPFFTRYVHWIGGLFSGHLGNSVATGQSVAGILAERLPVTLELGLVSLVLSVVFSLLSAVVAAHQRGRIVDRANIAVSMLGLSVPNFVFALILVFVFAVKLHWLPSSGFTSISAGLGQNIRGMILPSLSIAFGLTCGYNRVLRADLVDQLVGADYVMLARSKGISERRILFGHALRNAAFGFLTLVGLNLGTIIGGVVLIEEIFSLPGIGQELVQSITYHDTLVVESVVVILAVTVIAANFMTDMVYSLLDPRIRYDRSE